MEMLYSQEKINPFSTGFLIVCLFLSLFAFRMYINIETLRFDYTANVFRVGLVPCSDAKAWVDGATKVLNGQLMTGVPTCRPIYSLFLTVLFFLIGSSYVGVIYTQMMLSALVISLAYYLLKPVQNKVSVFLFLSFLAIWRPEVSTIFMTENLGIYILILSFAMLWRGLNAECENTTLSGIFLLGLSQAVRPWCVMSLVTVPFLSFFSNQPLKKRMRSFILYILFISLGFGFNSLSAGIFNKPGEDYANKLQTLYGQVAGGKGWISVYNDPIIKTALEKDLPSIELKKVFYKRIKDLFLENPRNLLKACISGYRFYFRQLPYSFDNKAPYTFDSNVNKPLFFSLFFIILVLANDHKLKLPHRRLIQNPLFIVALLLSLLLFVFQYAWFWTFFSLVGMISILRRPSKKNLFIVLFFIGILLSIPLVGHDGGTRVKIGNDIMMYFLSSLGLAWTIKLFSKTREEFSSEKTSSVNARLQLIGVLSITFIVLIGIPYVIKQNRQSNPKSSKLQTIQAKDIAGMLNLSEIPMSHEDLEVIWHRWPEPSFEKVNQRLCYYHTRYMKRDTIYLNAFEGITDNDWYISGLQWPLSPIGINRTLLIIERWYTLLPNISPMDLERYENKEIVVVGKLYPKPRPFMYATGFVLIVSHIVSVDDLGNLHWTAI